MNRKLRNICIAIYMPAALMAPLAALADLVTPKVTVSEHINIRMEADPQSEVIGRLRAGEGLPFQRTVPGWHEVTLADGAYGFVSAAWSDVLTDEDFAARMAAQASAADNIDASAAGTAETGSDSGDTGDADVAVTPAVATSDKAAAAAAASDATIDSEADAAIEAATEVADDTLAEATADDVEMVVTEVLAEGGAEPADDPDVAAADSAAEDAVANAESGTQADATAPVADDASRTTEAPVDIVAAAEPAPAEAVVIVGPAGPPGPPGPSGAATIKGTVDRLVRFTKTDEGGNSQIFDNGRNVGIGTESPEQRLEVNGNIRINELKSNVAGLIITQASGDTGYIMHNRANTLTIGAGSVDRLTIDRDGNLGVGVARPSQPLEMASGAYVSAGGVWTNSSSRERKENITPLAAGDAVAALAALEPVRFNYKRDDAEDYVGFIAEDVPDLVATADRQSLSTMDIVAVLTLVVQQQQRRIDELEAKFEARGAD